MKRQHTYSQHFLKSPRLVKELVGHSSIKSSDLAYDLGAGSGVISSVLAARARQVVSVETEPTALAALRKNMAHYDNVQVVRGDLLAVDFPHEPFKIFANIPFSLSSPLVRRLSQLPQPPTATYLIVQKQFGRKLLAQDRHFTSQLGALMYPWFSVRIRRPLRKTDYTPPPAVDTVLLEILPRDTPLVVTSRRGQYEQFASKAFETPAFFATIGAPEQLKPSQLTGEEWVALFQSFSKH